MAYNLACWCIQMAYTQHSWMLMDIVVGLSVGPSVRLFVYSIFRWLCICWQITWNKWHKIWHDVVIIGRWLLPSLVDTGDICCHYWQLILVCFGLDHLCSQTTTRSTPALVVLPVWRWDEWSIKTTFLDNFGLLTIRPRVGVCKQGIVTVHEPGSSVQPANPDAVSKWPGSNMAAPTAKLTTTWSSTSSGKISIYCVSNSTKFTKWMLTFEARMFITSMSCGTFLQGRN